MIRPPAPANPNWSKFHFVAHRFHGELVLSRLQNETTREPEIRPTGVEFQEYSDWAGFVPALQFDRFHFSHQIVVVVSEQRTDHIEHGVTEATIISLNCEVRSLKEYDVQLLRDANFEFDMKSDLPDRTSPFSEHKVQLCLFLRQNCRVSTHVLCVL